MITVKCFNIDYDVSEEVLDFLDDCHEAIVMPETVEIDIEDEDYEEFKSDLCDYLANEISERTGWLVNSFDWEILDN